MTTAAITSETNLRTGISFPAEMDFSRERIMVTLLFILLIGTYLHDFYLAEPSFLDIFLMIVLQLVVFCLMVDWV
jgi:hypothetical protein